MATEIEECCENCSFWKMPEGQTTRPFWGICEQVQGPERGTMRKYIRPVPEKLETVASFRCAVFFPSIEAMKEA
ncbi:MAG TPA: hypothetical protein VNZ03_00400 [Terriglobales bacterium]|jgi:hypothetical protein|nr:hypothetical protein [Terriglobales bacterium]